MSNLTEPQSLLKEIAKQTSGELTSVEVIAYVEALCQSASTLAAGEKDYTVKPSVVNSTLTVIFVYHSCSHSTFGVLPELQLCFELVWGRGGAPHTTVLIITVQFGKRQFQFNSR